MSSRQQQKKTTTTKQEILQTLHLSEDDLEMSEQSPDRPNLFYNFSYVNNIEDIEATFSSLICEVKKLNVKTPRTLIDCQTHKLCSVLYLVFEVYLGSDMYHANIFSKKSDC